MNTLIKILSIFLIISSFLCAEYQEIDTMVKTEFDVKENQEVYFKCKLGDKKGPIGIHFLLANLYTVEVSIYRKGDDETPFLTYKLAENQFQEIDTTDFNDYVYIVIKETYKYFYKDYITIYNPNEIIQLKSSEPLIINNFLSNNKYQMRFTSEKNVKLVYNTLNTEKNTRKITIKYENETITNQSNESNYQKEFNPGEINIIVENFVEEEKDTKILAQDFSLIIYEKSDYGFKKVNENEAIKSKYIYNNKEQDFYYYVDISNKTNSNTLNFKINFKHYLLQNVKFFTNIIYLDEEINETVLENNIPTDKKLPYSYDEDSDEYLRIYFRDINSEKLYKYLLVKAEITENEYYVGSKEIEISLGNEIEIFDLKERDNNKAFIINKTLIDYIPIYFKLVLNPNEKYLLTSQYQDLTSFIKGDLLNENNQINNNYLINTNEIIIISEINELSVKVFGSTTNKVIFYVEKIDNDKLISAENVRNNEIFEIKMNENECNEGKKYILGTYDYETYAYGENKVNYYATIDSGDFEVYYKDIIKLEDDESLFPSEQSQIQEFNKRIILDKNIDLFTVKCKKAGTMSIRPETKKFKETTHIIEQNTIVERPLYDYSEIVQLTTLLGQKAGTVYFSILPLEGQKLTIIPDTPGLFPEKTIENNDLFFSSADLSKYKMDQLAIRVNTTSLEKSIEILEIIHNKYNTYKKLNKGENKNIAFNNVYIPISEKNKKIKIVLENLERKEISYGVIKSASNNENYLTTADKYSNTTKTELKEKIENIDIDNIYYNKKDNLKPYMYLLVSVLGEEDNLSYNIKVEIVEDDKGDNTALIVFIALISAIVLGFIILALFMIVIKKKTRSIEIENEKADNLYSQNTNEVDP